MTDAILDIIVRKYMQSLKLIRPVNMTFSGFKPSQTSTMLSGQWTCFYRILLNGQSTIFGWYWNISISREDYLMGNICKILEDHTKVMEREFNYFAQKTEAEEAIGDMKIEGINWTGGEPEPFFDVWVRRVREEHARSVRRNYDSDAEVYREE